MTQLGPYTLGYNDTPECGIYHGDARELAKAIPDESVDLIFTDPVYDRIEDYEWLAETAARVLKPGGNLLVYFAQYHLTKTVEALDKYMQIRWLCIELNAGASARMWSYKLFANFKPYLWLTRPGELLINRWTKDLVYVGSRYKSKNHVWGKNMRAVEEILFGRSLGNDIIFDPFTGGGTIPAVCKQLGRQYLAFEIDGDTVQLARDRVRHTQPPLFVPQAEQQKLDL